jgi:DNA-binding response OmpR family regulator
LRVLLVEDHAPLAELVADGLRDAGFGVDCVRRAEDALAALAVVDYNTVLLDLGLPDDDGLSVLKEMRQRGDVTPVLILTARDGLSDRVAGLDQGADDYVLKPVETVELVARVRALVRRAGPVPDLALHVGNIDFDTRTRDVSIDGRHIPITPRERDVFEYLVRRAGNVVTKRTLEDGLYGFGETGGANSVEVSVHRLRKILDNAGATAEVHTLRGVGYLLSAPAPERPAD